MKILITGGAGFIGRHLIKKIIKKNEIVVLDNFSNSKIENILKWKSAGLKIFDGDIRKINDILNASKDVDLVIHLAAIISIEESIKNPKNTFDVNVEGTKNVLMACEINKIPKIIVASSASVYGQSKPNEKLVEKSNLNPISPYGESKLQMEKEVIEFSKKYKINFIILRFFNIFGIGQSKEYAGVITKFLENLAKNESLKIFGNGQQTRDFIFIQDVIRAIEKSIIIEKGGTFNIASGKAITIENLAKKVIEFSGKDLSIEFLKSRDGEILFSEADISKARKILNFSPIYKLEKISKIIHSIDENSK